jgi:hypothetical protein
MEFNGLEIEDFGKGYGSASKRSEDKPKPAEVILAVDLNSGYPAAAFLAPSLGYPQLTPLPAFEKMSKAREAELLTSRSFSQYDPDGSKSGQLGRDWIRHFLALCLRLLRERFGDNLANIRLQISLTARSDISDWEVAVLVKTTEAAGFSTIADHAIQVVPISEAAAIAAVKRYLYIGGPESPRLKYGDNILLLHFDGDMLDIQSYSLSAGSTKAGFRMEGLAAGQTINCRKMVDEQFIKWLEATFGSSFSRLSSRDTDRGSRLMSEFTRVRRKYDAGVDEVYNFPLILTNPPRGSPYDSGRCNIQLQDSQMEDFFETATTTIWDKLHDHRAKIGKDININKIVFAGEKNVSPYVENHILDWGESTGILTAQTNIQVFQARIPSSMDYLRFELTLV